MRLIYTSIRKALHLCRKTRNSILINTHDHHNTTKNCKYQTQMIPWPKLDLYYMCYYRHNGPWNKSLFTCLILHAGPLSSSGQIFPLKPRWMSSSNIISCQWPIIQLLEKNRAGGREKEKEEKVNVWMLLALPQVNASRIYESFSRQLCLSGPLLGSSGCPWKMCVPESGEEA